MGEKVAKEMSKGNSSSNNSEVVASTGVTPIIFKVTLSIRKEGIEAGEPSTVYMKQDGQRFKLPRTLKLAVDSTYRVDLSFKPPQNLRNLLVQDQETKCCEKSKDSTASAYSAQYPTFGIPISKNGVRHDIPLIMQMNFNNDCDLIVSLQVKFYKQQDSKHGEWGSSLHCIEYECTYLPGSERVCVTKETYRLSDTRSRH